MGLSAVGTPGVFSVVSDEMFVEVVTVPFGISVSVPGVVRVFASSAVRAARSPVVIPTYDVSRVGSGLEPTRIITDKVEIVITAIMASVATTIVIILLLVAGIVKFKTE